MKSLKQVFYALKVFPKLEMDYQHIKKIDKFKKLGLLGNKCRFIVETIAIFENEVNTNPSIHTIIKM